MRDMHLPRGGTSSVCPVLNGIACRALGVVVWCFLVGVRQAQAQQTTEQANAALLPHDLSPWSMFLNADIVVKAVMAGLAFASVVTWTVSVAKGIELFGARAKASSAVRKVAAATALTEAGDAVARGWIRRGEVVALLQAAQAEILRSGSLPSEGIKERVAISLGRVEAQAARAMNRGTGLLATIGATAPFVGLFGTVWGIMNSFIGIADAKTTNLAVVAPGIAEALLATAIGLVAAIPAVVIYNVFARSITGYRAIMSDASAEILRHVSRDLDARAAEEARQALGLSLVQR